MHHSPLMHMNLNLNISMNKDVPSHSNILPVCEMTARFFLSCLDPHKVRETIELTGDKSAWIWGLHPNLIFF